MLKDAIYEAMQNLGRTVSISQVKEWIDFNYPEYRESDIGTAMADLTIDGNQSSQYTVEGKFLRRVNRGIYTLG